MRFDVRRPNTRASAKQTTRRHPAAEEAGTRPDEHPPAQLGHVADGASHAVSWVAVGSAAVSPGASEAGSGTGSSAASSAAAASPSTGSACAGQPSSITRGQTPGFLKQNRGQSDDSCS